MRSDFGSLRDERNGRVLGLVMAAGFSRRFGREDKRVQRLANGVSLLGSTLSRVQPAFTDTSGKSLLAVALRPEDCPTALGISEACLILRAPNARRGLGASIADAITAVQGLPATDAIDSVAILLGDMPAVQRATLTALISASRPDTIVRPRFRGKCGHPVIFGRKFWPALSGLSGDEGARQVIAAHVSALVVIDVDDPGTLLDIDTTLEFERHTQVDSEMASNLLPAAQD